MSFAILQLTDGRRIVRTILPIVDSGGHVLVEAGEEIVTDENGRLVSVESSLKQKLADQAVYIRKLERACEKATNDHCGCLGYVGAKFEEDEEALRERLCNER